MEAFQKSFHLDKHSAGFSNLQGDIVSVLQAGCFFGAMSSFYLSDKFGRKKALIIADLIFLVGSIVQTTCAIGTHSLTQLYIGRVIGGFGVGLVSAVVPTYLGENANKEIRGRCVGCMQLFNVTGICLSFFVNYGINNNKSIPKLSAAKWRIPFALQCLPGILLLLGIVWQNESPRWLVEKNRPADAAKALARVRGRSVDDPVVVSELNEIVQDFKGRERLTLWEQAQAACASKSVFYRCSMAVLLMFFQQMTGTNSINYFAPQIFSSIGVKGTSAGLFATGVYGIVKMIFTGLGLMLGTEQIGRKWCLLVGSAGQAFAMLYIGINTAVNPVKAGASLDANSTFAIVCVYLFGAFYSFSWGPIPYVLSSECSPNHVRSLVMALALMMQWLINFSLAKLTPVMLSNIKYGTYLLLFEGDIIKGCIRDTIPRYARAKKLQHHHISDAESETGSGGTTGAAATTTTTAGRVVVVRDRKGGA